jgi:glutathione transport system permease protein
MSDAAEVTVAPVAIRTPLGEFWRRLRRKRYALAAGFVVAVIVLLAVFAPLVAPFDPSTPDYENLLSPPSLLHLCGTDAYGRDIFSRILWGGRVSLTVGVLSVALGGISGVAIGLVAGYFGGWTDSVLMRLMDVLLAFPGILLAIAVIAVLGPGIDNVIYAISVFSIPVFARLARGSTLALRQTVYVQAARSIGVKRTTIMARHILPGLLPTAIVNASLRIGTAIVTAASLSFIGLGARPPSPEWGAMLSDGRSYLGVDDYLTIFPGIAIFVTVLALSVFGDGLRDALDQRLR